MKIKIVTQDGYPFTGETTNFEGNEPVYMMGFAAKAAEIFLDAQKQLDAFAKTHDLYKDMDVYIDGIILGLEGGPVGLVSLVDDIPYYTPLAQGSREDA